MGDHSVPSVRRGLSRGLRGSLALIALFAVNAACRATQALEPPTAELSIATKLDLRQRALRAALEAGGAAVTDAIALVEEIERTLASDEETERWRLHIALSKACYDVMTFQGGPIDERRSWADRAARAGLAAAQPALALRARFLEAQLLDAADQQAAATEVLSAALAGFPEAPGWDIAATFLSGLLRAQGRYADADRHLRRVEDAMRDASDEELTKGRVLACRIQLDLDLGLPDRARAWVHRERAAVEALRDRGDANQDLITKAHIRQANLRYALGEYGQTVALIDEFLTDSVLYAAAPSAALHLRRMKGLALLDWARLEPDRLPEAGVVLNSLDADAGSAHDRLRLQLARAEYHLRTGSIEAAREALAAASAGMDTVDSLRDAVHVARVRAKIARVGGTREELEAALPALERGFDALLDEWRKLPIRAGGVGFLRKSTRRGVLGELIQLRIALDPDGGPTAALNDLLRAQANATIARRSGVESVTVDVLQRELLSEGHGLIVYLTAPDASHVFAVDQNGVRHEPLDPEDKLQELCDAYVAKVGAPPDPTRSERSLKRASARESEESRETARDLLPPAISDRLASWTRVTVSTVDWLESLPFACLQLESGQRLGLALAIDHLSCLPLGPSLRRRADRDRSTEYETDLLLIADSVASPAAASFWPGLLPLEIDPRRLSRLAGCFPEQRTRHLTGASATRESLEASALATTRIAQFLVHGVWDATEERSAALVLTPSQPGDDGLLRASQVDALRSPRFVMLTSCGSGSAPLRIGDNGSAGMSAAWLENGAQAVLHARSAIALEPTLVMSAQLLERLARGDTPADALLAARRRVADDPRYHAPFYYGLLRIEGLGHRPLVP